jgi:hypothetical protein
MKREELKLHHGGLMRCCTQSFADWVDAQPDALTYPGEKITCKYENKDTMEVDEFGIVRWRQEPV